jgi:hypothetical protein
MFLGYIGLTERHPLAMPWSGGRCPPDPNWVISIRHFYGIITAIYV